MNTNKQRYAYLLGLCQQGVATLEETQEFYALCQKLLYEVLTQNIDVLERLRDK